MKIIKLTFVAVIILALAYISADSILDWLHKRNEGKKLMDWMGVSVVKIDNSIPPGLVVEVENKGPRAIGVSHFRLLFNIEDKTIWRADEDFGGFPPQEKREITLKCALSKSVPHRQFQRGTKVHYWLGVFPEWKKMKKPLEGEFTLK